MGEDYDYAAIARRARLLLVLMAVATIGSALAGSAGLVHHRRVLGPNWTLAILVTPFVVFLVLTLLWIPIARQSRPVPDRFVATPVDGVPAFVGPSAPAATGPWASAQLVALPALAASQAVLGIWDAPADVDLTFKVLYGAMLLGLAAFGVGWGLRIFTAGGRVVLWPDRLQVPTGAGGCRTMPWHELMPGGPHPPPNRRTRLTLFRTPRRAVRRLAGEAGWNRRVSMRPNWTAVDPAYLADAIRYYVEHPQYRERIGQPGEQERLREAIIALRAAGTTSGWASR